MARLAAFVSLERGDETDTSRFKTARGDLSINVFLGKAAHGDGDIGSYPRKALQLVRNIPGADAKVIVNPALAADLGLTVSPNFAITIDGAAPTVTPAPPH